ncbi:hypothetical protein LOZ52_000773 [Ophidiomyces ophidiicola]|nr:hypothetical protein LOZ64_003045 [Ophidiomyces ophidiicola]KAI2014022.1 hypothetical protein LOZ49_001662 [Ophidiomyces ophidiicola]KAI2027153.1 hypothetical protein LOZ46_000233 [Ophidiomyces ophidiicola]KAI2133117.1 hypothetical protein LOZ29_004843 [Ophidiomyces ophidiicola]KAI2134931.1 hypothetical protein LOZ28_004766 [Ophidiomyces ophidiicola]
MAHDGTITSSFQNPAPVQLGAVPPTGKAHRPMGARVSEERQQSLPDEAYERLVFTDPVIFKSLEEDPSTILAEKRCALVGFEIYIVEQWACSRAHPTFVINTYTGDTSHSAVASVLKVPKDEQFWSPKLKIYFEAIAKCYSRRRETPLGILMVTNLSSFPSSLTVIDVPEGDVRKYREEFVVNEDLKRLGCSGRAGLNLKPPAPATEAKFYQLYRITERVPLFNAVINLVKLCQLSLNVFGKLALEYVDGLLCDETERAINDWWADIGTELYNVEPSDGILGPTTVAALLGTLIGARNRLHAWGAPVAKDPFDIEGLKRGIGSFQRSQKLEKTRRLDRQTVDKLHRVTAKAASGEGWAVPRAVKSTVAELGGKGGEMVMEIVGGRDRAGISEVETLDIDRFVQLASGERTKWLWHGKPGKSQIDPFRYDAGDDDIGFPKDVWIGKRKDTGSGLTSGRPSLETEQPWKHLETAPTIADNREQQVKHSLKKSVSVRVSDARAGLGRFRDAVGLPALRSHHRKSSEDTFDAEGDLPSQQTSDSERLRHGTKTKVEGTQLTIQEASDSGNSGVEREAPEILPNHLINIPTTESSRTQADLQHQSSAPSEKSQGASVPRETSIEAQMPPSVPDVATTKSDGSNELVAVTRILHRPQSFSFFPPDTPASQRSSQSLRHMSFSAIEEPMLCWSDVGFLEPADMNSSVVNNILYEDLKTEDARTLSTGIFGLDTNTSAWVEEKVEAVEAVESKAQSRLSELESVYQNKESEKDAIQTSSADIISKNSEDLLERSKKLETLGAKLDYEVNALQSRVEEVENALVDYEHHVNRLENRMRELSVEAKKSSTWVEWCQRCLSRRPW